ncbi:MAG: glycosyltransferase [Micavibrio sp.]
MKADSFILIDVTRLIGRMMERGAPTGIDRVCQHYICRYREKAQAVLYWGRYRVVYSPAASLKIFGAIGAWRRISPLGLYGLYWADRLRCFIPRTRGKIFLNTAHSGIENDWYAADLHKMGVRPVFMVHDLIPVLYPDYVREGEEARHHARLRNMLRSAAGFITNSRQTLAQLSSYADDHGWLMPPAQAALLGTQKLDLSGVRARKPYESPYFLILGTIEARKNHLMLLKLWKELISEMGEAAPQLVIVGQRGWKCDEAVGMLDHDASLKNHIHEIGACDDARLCAWMKGARALLFPSLAEGYGMPLSEALSVGVLVIASDLAVFREVAGDVPDYLPALDADKWKAAIKDYCHGAGGGLRQAQEKRLENYSAPSWDAHFDVIEAFLASAETMTRPDFAWAYGFSWRKRRIIKRFLPDIKLRFTCKLDNVPVGSPLIVWGSPAQDLARWNVIRVEDGFIRSVGLGAALVKPSSLVIDPVGIYYDSAHPSQLERILENHIFSESLLERAGNLRKLITEKHITKYNLAGARWKRPENCKAPVILVVGQVESDASIRRGSPFIQKNIGLLKAVRERHPGAYILYKPHPDVVAGLRRQGEGEGGGNLYADEIITDISIEALFAEIDELHTLTSLSGFEALLRGVKVVCYGQPFYAGWGLTTDIFPIEGRRGRRIKLDELVAATLILYPAYGGCSGMGGKERAEDIVEKLASAQQKKHHPLARLYQGLLEMLLRRTAY